MGKFPYLLVIFLLTLHLLLLSNLQFTAWPEMLSYAYLRNHGFLLYKDMIHPYPPILTMGLSWVYSILGYHLWVLKAVAWGIILLSSLLVWFIVRYLTKSEALAVLVLAIYVLMQPFLEGNMLWFDIAIVPPILLGLLFLLRFIKNDGDQRLNLIFSGLFLAIGGFTKQTAGLYFVFSILYLAFYKLRFKQIKYLLVGPLVLGAPLIVRLLQEDALQDFFNWVIWYPATEWGKIIGYVQMELSTKDWLIIVLLFAPLIFLILNRQIFRNRTFQLLLIFLVISLITVYPRFSFFHFQTALALLVIIYAYLLSKTQISRITIAYSLVSIALILFLVHQPVISRDWQKETRFYGSGDLQLAKLIADKTTKNDTIFLLGLNSSLYTMSDRLPPERWTDNFSWYLEIPGVQEEIIFRWEDNSPKFVFWRTPSPGNPSDLGTYQPQKIVAWTSENYTKKEEVRTEIWLWEKN